VTPPDAAVGQDRDGMDGAWIRTVQLLERGDWEQARTWIGRILSQHPDDPLHLRALATCQLGLGLPAEARSTVSRLFSVCGPEADLFRLLSRIELAEGRRKPALAAAMDGLRRAPREPESHVAVARCAAAGRDWDTLETCVRQALALDPRHEEALHLLAVARSLRGDHDESRAASRSILATDPESANGHSSLGWTLLRAGDHEGARTHFRESLRIDPSHPGAKAGLLESLKARNAPYRAYLWWNRKVAALTTGKQYVLVFGLLIGMQLVSRIRGGILGLLAALAVFAYFLFMMWTWMAPGVGNVLLWKDRDSRLLLGPAERRSALCVGLPFLAGIGAFFGGMASGSGAAVHVGATLFLSAIASSLWIENDHPLGVRVYQAVAVAALAFGLAVFPGWVEPMRYVPHALFALTLAGTFRFLHR